jgi:predicted nucleotidyltransferase
MNKNIDLIGNIDEDFKLPKENFNNVTELNVDFSKVKKINSFDLREFIFS